MKTSLSSVGFFPDLNPRCLRPNKRRQERKLEVHGAGVLMSLFRFYRVLYAVILLPHLLIPTSNSLLQISAKWLYYIFIITIISLPLGTCRKSLQARKRTRKLPQELLSCLCFLTVSGGGQSCLRPVVLKVEVGEGKAILAPRGCWATSGHILVVPIWWVGVPGTQWVEVRISANHLQCIRTAPMAEISMSNISSAESRNPTVGHQNRGFILPYWKETGKNLQNKNKQTNKKTSGWDHSETDFLLHVPVEGGKEGIFVCLFEVNQHIIEYLKCTEDKLDKNTPGPLL